MKSIVMLLCAAFCVLGGILHSVGGVPVLASMLAKTSVAPDLAKELLLVWLFMGTAIITFGLILFTCGLRMRKGNYTGTASAMWVAAFLILFDASAMIWWGKFEPHFAAFLLAGVLVAFAAMPPKSPSKAA